MAGRGTDIILGGNPETMVWAMLQGKYKTRLDVPREEWDQLVREVEEKKKMKPRVNSSKRWVALHIIGTERHESRRIDLRCAVVASRQGDPGTVAFTCRSKTI